jgi:hypothetical protein
MKDEKLYTQFGPIRSGFLATLIFNFLTLGGSPAWTGWDILVKYISKNQKFNNLSKTVSLVEIFHRGPTKIINLVKKVVKNRRFLVIFSTKTSYCSLDLLDRSIKVGFKMKYNCYMLQIQVLQPSLKSVILTICQSQRKSCEPSCDWRSRQKKSVVYKNFNDYSGKILM